MGKAQEITAFFLQTGNRDVERLFVPGMAPQGPVWGPILPFFLMLLNSEGKGGKIRKGINF